MMERESMEKKMFRENERVYERERERERGVKEMYKYR